jgi:hypothetical protein
MLTCLLVGLQTASHRAVNFNKLREIIQHPTKNPADFLGCLTETLTCYTLIYLNSRRWQELTALSEFMCRFSVTDLSQVEKRLNFSNDSTSYIKEFNT